MAASPESSSSFFRLDLSQGELSAAGQPVPVPPKSIELLRFLVLNAGHVVARTEIVESVWGGLSVSADAVRHTVRQLRKALEDPVDQPLFIETVARRCWRFIGTAVPVDSDIWILEPVARSQPGVGRRSRSSATRLVGRDAENALLDESLARAVAGERQFVLISGEAGIGKTSLVEAFLSRARAVPDVVVARGDCIEHVGSGMPHWPLFELVEQVCAEFGGQLPLAMMRRHAPNWLAELPSLASQDDGDLVRRPPRARRPPG